MHDPFSKGWLDQNGPMHASTMAEPMHTATEGQNAVRIQHPEELRPQQTVLSGRPESRSVILDGGRPDLERRSSREGIPEPDAQDRIVDCGGETEEACFSRIERMTDAAAYGSRHPETKAASASPEV